MAKRWKFFLHRIFNIFLLVFILVLIQIFTGLLLIEGKKEDALVNFGLVLAPTPYALVQLLAAMQNVIIDWICLWMIKFIMITQKDFASIAKLFLNLLARRGCFIISLSLKAVSLISWAGWWFTILIANELCLALLNPHMILKASKSKDTLAAALFHTLYHLYHLSSIGTAVCENVRWWARIINWQQLLFFLRVAILA